LFAWSFLLRVGSIGVYLLIFYKKKIKCSVLIAKTPNWCYYQSGISATGIKAALFQQNSPTGLGSIGLSLKNGF
ncbi:MAG: hypothetical protein IKL48_03470, partial [Elusimicrobiaceae bacterium]|nr:hypothetical protein [Elusimicrobiaceae bacterium]